MPFSLPLLKRTVASLVGQTVSHYRILEPLGTGGMGVVYKAQDLKLDRPVALKFLPPDLTRDPDAKERFIREAQAASALQHDNICTIHDIDETPDGQLFICMDLYNGVTLKNRIERGAISNEEALGLTIQIARGLAKAHDAGIVHRDVKPANIMITPEGEAKILDFGLAKLAGKTMLTKTGSTAGTAAYMSPEQVRGEEVDHRSDIWSLGAVLYEMIAGRPPFRGEYDNAVMYGILNAEPVPLRVVRSDAPEGYERILSRMLCKDPAGRYATLRELLSDLDSLSEGTRLRSVPAGGGQRSKATRKFRTIAAVLGIILVATFAFLLRPESERSRSKRIIAALSGAIQNGRFDTVYQVFSNASVNLQDPGVRELARPIAGTLWLETVPPGARVSLAYVSFHPTLSLLPPLPSLQTPVEGRTAVAGEYLAGLMLEGYTSVELLVHLRPADSLLFARTLVPTAAGNDSMVQVAGGISTESGPIAPFLIDKHEVTNEQFFQFVSAGGYMESRYWDSIIVVEGRSLLWPSARRKFLDQTGLPSPRFWSRGRYPEGKARHPVVGVTWYEAMAFARWAGKNLPSSEEWRFAALGGMKAAFPWGDDVKHILERANFGLVGTEPVGSHPLGVSPFGCYDMAGNAKEWLRDRSRRGELYSIAGGSWRDEPYMFEASHVEFFEPLSAAPDISFRCVKSLTASSTGDHR